MVKKILIITGLCLLGGYLIFAAFFFEKKPQEKVCSHFEVVIDNGSDDKFIDASDIEKDVNEKGLNPYGKQLKEVDTYAIQQEILSNKLISSASVFITSDGGIRAVIQERIPVLRIITNNGDSYYVDKKGEVMPLSNRNTAYLPLATGNIKEEFAATDLYKFALYLYDNAFWNAQIEQIVVRSDNDISLVTRIGDQEVLMGSLENYEEKLAKLKTFYTEALPSTGWNRYSKLNLKYDKQVVGTKR
ncbi:cell division protein FtsQ/DivIB [Dysgonomonas macrotermitis]|uniref:Cell division protein FtsQ n=1 Tax=Dysgonomonas macrotermitis TaxID=1346286 RepID=A0A1M4U8C7_9BACT|nr:cell division protein FtsQ/DivIB [Dysgonomonas macrotermitis]SHE52985.1 cell division protein FtsQ [Dysgonomonas macrotermitis]